MTTIWLEQQKMAAERYKREHGESPLTAWWEKTDTHKIKIRTHVRKRFYIAASGGLPSPENRKTYRR